MVYLFMWNTVHSHDYQYKIDKKKKANFNNAFHEYVYYVVFCRLWNPQFMGRRIQVSLISWLLELFSGGHHLSFNSFSLKRLCNRLVLFSSNSLWSIL